MTHRHPDAATWLTLAECALAREPSSAEELFSLVDQGILIRRRLRPADEERSQQLVIHLTELQYRCLELLRTRSEIDNANNDLQRLAALVDDAVRRDDLHAGEVLSTPDADTGVGLARCDRLLADLQWYGFVASHLEGEPEPDRATVIQSRLEHLSRSLDFDDDKVGDDRLQRDRLHWKGECLQLRRRYLDRRIADELGVSADDASPGREWSRRFQLSRLEADRIATEFADSDSESASATKQPDELKRLENRQQELAERAEKKTLALPEAERANALEELLAAAEEESNDVLTLAEDLPLPAAVALLRSSSSDLRRLGATVRRAEASMGKSRRRSRQIARLARRKRNELQEKQLSLRMERIFGRRGVAWIENTVLVLILVMTVLIALEWLLVGSVRDPSWLAAWFAWADLAICSVFLSEFFLKLALAPSRPRYFLRHFIVDFLASIPWGFLTFQWARMDPFWGDETALLRLLRFLRLPQLARYLRPAQPLVRIGRLIFFLLRSLDRLVRKHASLLNQNIVFFEPRVTHAGDSDIQLRLARLREQVALRSAELEQRLSLPDRIERVSLSLGDLAARLDAIPTTAPTEPARPTALARDLSAEEVVRELVEMTPERLAGRMGAGFPETVDRYLRLFDLPGIRRLPVIRDLLAARARGTGEVAALSVNRFGHGLQSILDVGYFFADLHGTISGPIFADRLGTVIVSATARNAKRLLIFGGAMLALYGLVWLLQVSWLQGVVGWLERILGVPARILGAVCLVFMLLGSWLRKIANQASERGERLVEAQFAAQTKILRQRYVDSDVRFLAERVVAPELYLRALDDPFGSAKPINTSAADLLDQARRSTLLEKQDQPGRSNEAATNEELLFLRTVALLHRDFQDTGMFRPTDVKTSTQLLGSPALANLRETSLGRRAQESRTLQSLDAKRSALFGGPQLWFNYMTRIITEETAKRLEDYNRHAIPLTRLECGSEEYREQYRAWLARRLRRSPGSISLPKPRGGFAATASAAGSPPPPELASNGAFESLDFTTIDLLTMDPARDAQLEQKYGRDLIELLARDRKRTIRRAFRSFSIHRYSKARRTINPLSLYMDHAAGGRVFLLPFKSLWWITRAIAAFFSRLRTTVKEVLQPEIVEEVADETDAYATALRKIHRMRKPGFMAALWLRARFDLEYLGVALPGLPSGNGATSLLGVDLNFIGGSRRDRLAANRLVSDIRSSLAQFAPVMRRLGFDLDALPRFLDQNYPHLASRYAEVMRALATAWISDDRGIATLARSLDGLQQMVAHALAGHDIDRIPPELPDSIMAPRRSDWAASRQRSMERAIRFAGFSNLSPDETQRVMRYLKRQWPVAGGWLALIQQGVSDPMPHQVLMARIREVIVRTDLWSDEIVVLRSLQSLAMLDVHHYCRMVWTLGGYGEIDSPDFPAKLPVNAELLEWSDPLAAVAGA